MSDTVLTDEQVQSIVNADIHDPFSILGLHPTSDGEARVNAFLPDARRAIMVPENEDRKPEKMSRVHSDGLFEATFSTENLDFRYRISIENFDGEQRKFYDPYQFEPVLSDYELHLLGEGKNYRVYETLGCQPHSFGEIEGYSFAVWAPNADRVSVVGDFNSWDGRRNMMRCRGDSGIWELFLPGLVEGDNYKFEIQSREGDLLEKADPFAFCSEHRPKTGSVVYELPDYDWNDADWMENRSEKDHARAPINAYEVHLQSWRRGEDGEMLDYRDLAHQLVDYLDDMNYTHVELMPVLEHPLDESWGYQVTGFYAPTRRLGDPEDFMYFVDYLHENGFGVLLDWVPGHFPKDDHGLAEFDGTCLYEYPDPRKGHHPDWGTCIFNYDRNEVRNFLIGNALFWLDRYHVDGLRVDAVASMLYLDYSREAGEWVPNKYGGRENLEAISLLREFNEVADEYYPGAITIAEESTDWGGVTRPTYAGGLGFDFKWNMGWMHDSLEYMSKDPVYRQYHHGNISFMLYYAFQEDFVLVLSHDEVVHMKNSLLEKMPGDDWQKFANLRLLYGFQTAHPGKQLLFIGGEFGQRQEWRFDQSLDWHLLDHESHSSLQNYVAQLNGFYQDRELLWKFDPDDESFRWIDFSDSKNSVVSFVRRRPETGQHLLFVFNFTPVPREEYRVGVPGDGPYREIFSSDSKEFWGSDVPGNGRLEAIDRQWQGEARHIKPTLPPLGFLVFSPE